MIKRHLRNIDYDTAEKQFNNMIDTSIEISQCIINVLLIILCLIAAYSYNLLFPSHT